jgi:hypothetical protein
MASRVLWLNAEGDADNTDPGALHWTLGRLAPAAEEPSRHTPPFGVAPISASAIRLAHSRLPLACRLRIRPSRLSSIDSLHAGFNSLFGRFNSLFDRFNSLFGRLGNLPSAQLKKQ